MTPQERGNIQVVYKATLLLRYDYGGPCDEADRHPLSPDSAIGGLRHESSSDRRFEARVITDDIFIHSGKECRSVKL
jgi:hypothetical protein